MGRWLLLRALPVPFPLALPLIVGRTPYQPIGEASWLDTLYMKVITVSTVVSGAVEPLDPPGGLARYC